MLFNVVFVPNILNATNAKEEVHILIQKANQTLSLHQTAGPGDSYMHCIKFVIYLSLQTMT